MFFLLWFVYNYKNHGVNASTFLLFLYLLTGLSTIPLLYIYKTYDIDKISLESVLSLILLLFLFLYPIVKIGNKKFGINLSSKHINIFAWFIIVFSLTAIVDSIPQLNKTFSYEEILETRSLYNETLGEIPPRTNSVILNMLLRAGTQYSFFAVFFAFYYNNKKKNNFLFIMLLVSSLSFIIHNLNVAGRDGIIRWIFAFIFSYLVFKDSIDRRMKRKLLLIITPIFILLLIVFWTITEARFGERIEAYMFGPFYSIFNYLGQSPIYFSYRYDLMFEGNFGKKYINVPTNIFSTFVGSIYYDYGFFITLAFGIVFFIVLYSLSRYKKNYTRFPFLIIYIYIYQIVVLGIFYHMFRYASAIRYFLLLFMFSIILHINDNITSKR